MSLLNDDFDIDSIFILKSKIEKYIKGTVLSWIYQNEYNIIFIKCDWNKIIDNLGKYYVYVNVDVKSNILFVRIDKISKSLPGEFGGPYGDYVMIHHDGKETPLSKMLNL